MKNFVFSLMLLFATAASASDERVYYEDVFVGCDAEPVALLINGVPFHMTGGVFGVNYGHSPLIVVGGDYALGRLEDFQCPDTGVLEMTVTPVSPVSPTLTGYFDFEAVEYPMFTDGFEGPILGDAPLPGDH